MTLSPVGSTTTSSSRNMVFGTLSTAARYCLRDSLSSWSVYSPFPGTTMIFVVSRCVSRIALNIVRGDPAGSGCRRRGVSPPHRGSRAGSNRLGKEGSCKKYPRRTLPFQPPMSRYPSEIWPDKPGERGCAGGGKTLYPFRKPRRLPACPPPVRDHSVSSPVMVSARGRSSHPPLGRDDTHSPLAELLDRGMVSRSIGDDACHFGQADDGVGADGPEFFDAPDHVGVGRPADEDPLHGGLVGVAGGEPLLSVYASQAKEVEVGGDAASRFGRGGTASGDGVLEQPAPQDEDVHGRVARQSCRGRRAVRDNRRVQVGTQRRDDSKSRRSAVQDGRAPWCYELGGAGGHPPLAFRRNPRSDRDGAEGRRGGQRPAVNPLAEPGGGQFPEVSAEAVL